jgi:anti-sigma B factor antagonist
MQLTVIREDDSITHVALLGDLNIEGVNRIQDRFVFTTTSRRKATLVDVSQVTFIASLGMGMLVSAAKALHRNGAVMVLLAPTSMVLRALDAAGINRVIPIASGEEEAMQLLHPSDHRPA